MSTVAMSNLRNVVLAGHADSGKTTLAEHLLLKSGANTRLGKVDDNTSTFDFEPEEHKRKLSLSLAMATLEHDGHRVTLVDTPGYADFAGEMISGFAAVDGALITMDASAGVEAGVDRAIALGRSTGKAALFVITRCDRENADPTAALDALRAAFGSKIAPLQLAIGRADGFKGYVDLVHRRAWEWSGGTRSEVPVPDELADEVARRRDQLLEAAAEADDDVLAKYLEGEEVSDAELEACLHRGVRDSILAPVLVTAASRDVGIEGLLDAIIRYLPSPEEEPPVKAKDDKGNEVEAAPAADGPLVAQVFKTTADPFVGRLSYFRVFSGAISSHDHVWNAERGEEERIGQVLRVKGKDTEPAGSIGAGEIGAVAKLVHTVTGDTLSSRERPLTMPRFAFPEPTLPLAVEPETKTDLDKLGPALVRLLEEDPSMKVERQAETGEQLLWAQGENQIAVAVERLKRKFGTSVVTRSPRVPYRETIRGKTQVQGRHKKQTGGRGQFGEVFLEIEPNPEGGVAFATRIVGGSVPRQFWPGVEKGVREVADKGPLAGYPVIDFKATLYDGSFHNVDSDELSFRLAGAMATRKGLVEAQPVLLEPIMDVEVRVPEEYMGDVNRDLNTRRGRVLGMEADGQMQVVRAHVPQSELFTYATELRSFTGGRGQFTASLAHYEEVPAHVAQKIIDTHARENAEAH
ncbi:MAG TPA: elongation factor G [Candidatus Limnocylindrales bacterium]|nr:elongation factor G [Candidatus Limnocylindrales bacterium]